MIQIMATGGDLKNKIQVDKSTFFFKLVAWLLSIVASFLIGFVLFLIGVIAAVYIYALKHPIPLGEDNIAVGFIGIYHVVIVFLCAVVFSLFLIKILKKFFSKLLGVIYERSKLWLRWHYVYLYC